MSPTGRGREKSTSRDDLQRLQAEANEELLLAALRASEQADDAHGAQERAEQEVVSLKNLEKELLNTAEFRECLIGIIGHDLRNPLAAILITCGNLIGAGRLSEEDAQAVARIVRSGRRMARMIGQLDDFTRARAGGGFALTKSQTDLGEVCRGIIEELQIVTPVTWQQTTHGDLSGVWDADRLAQALSNIASNAADHAASGTPALLELHGEGDWVTVAITNTGPCIPPELLPVIFSAFRRAEPGAEARNGHLGLGLFVACEITRAHGGTLNVRSSEGSTTFSMRLPRTPSES